MTDLSPNGGTGPGLIPGSPAPPVPSAQRTTPKGRTSAAGRTGRPIVGKKKKKKKKKRKR